MTMRYVGMMHWCDCGLGRDQWPEIADPSVELEPDFPGPCREMMACRRHESAMCRAMPAEQAIAALNAEIERRHWRDLGEAAE